MVEMCPTEMVLSLLLNNMFSCLSCPLAFHVIKESNFILACQFSQKHMATKRTLRTQDKAFKPKIFLIQISERIVVQLLFGREKREKGRVILSLFAIYA